VQVKLCYRLTMRDIGGPPT